MTPSHPSQIEQERLLFRYSMALERGDFETVATILETAARNPSLNRMIQELDAAYSTDIDSGSQTLGEHTMSQPPIPHQKQKHVPYSRRSSLLFPFAAITAIALVGLAFLAFNQQSGSEGTNQGPIVTTTPLPYTQSAPGVIVPIYCEGVTRGEPETLVFTRPFVSETQGMIIGRYEPNSLVPINDIETDNTGETWYYIGDSNSSVERGDQGWANSLHIEVMENCVNLVNEINPTLTQTPPTTPTQTHTPTPTTTPTFTETSTLTPTPIPTETPSSTFTPTPTLTETPSSTPTALR